MRAGRARQATAAHRRRWVAWWWPLAVLAACAVVALVSGTAEGGFTGAVVNAGDTVQTGTLLTSGTSGGTTECDLGASAANPITSANTAICTGGLLASGTLPTLATSALSTVVKADGSLSASSASLVAGACGAIDMTDTATATDPMLVRGSSFTFAQTGPLTGGSSLGFSGSSAYTSDTTQVAGPTTTSFTELAWFKATVGGTLMGFANTQTPTGVSNWDKMLWVDNTGHVVFGSYTGAATEVTSTKAYNDGSWHLAVATLSTTGGTTLYVDGQVAGTSTTLKSAQAYNGYWHLGWDNETNGWSDPPTDAYLTGSLADAAVLPSALTAAQVTALSAVTTQASWATTLAGDAPTYAWPLADTGTTLYTGTVPGNTVSPCSFVDATVGLSAPSASCTIPASTAACAAPAGTTTLATVGASGTTAFKVAPTVTTSITVVTTMARDLANTVTLYPNATGLHVSLPLSVNVATSGFSATLSWPVETVLL